MALDVAYTRGDDGAEIAFAAAPLIADWRSDHILETPVARLDAVAPYAPGRFFERELPCLRAALALLDRTPQAALVDGYVTLDPAGRKGLGAHLFEALGRTTAVVGVAKTAFRSATHARAVTRGGATAPLFVTAEGCDVDEAAALVATMSGPHRSPDLLRAADRAARVAASAKPPA